jgi:putative peptidoglycan binding protein
MQGEQMTLNDVVASGGEGIALTKLAADEALVRETQARLTAIGILDPPADGKFGGVSQWALAEFAKAAKLAYDEVLSPAIATALLAPDSEKLFRLTAGTALAGKIVKAMQKRGDWICRHPDCFNIIYVEGFNLDGTANKNEPNRFNDMRLLLQVGVSGSPSVVAQWEGTTEPGRYWTQHPMNAKGAARITFGQYKSWVVGMHHAGKPSAHEALVQAEKIRVCRDLNKDFLRIGDTIDEGLFAINQHWGYDAPIGDLKTTSAGCLVGRTTAGHKQFMHATKSDPRYAANHGYRFMTSVFPGAEILAA